jgi:predicted TIM-barrel fold metal-dependent hydrolase
MAHIGGDFIRGVESIVPYTNVFVDPSGSYGERGMVDYAVAKLGSARVLFGSDMPGSDLYHNLGKITGADLSPSQREDILWKNAERVLP